jgi:serine/threonine protein kinase
MSFDPYATWLEIPPDEQPPDHYRLLGLTQFESDANAIMAAADAKMAHIRNFQTGPRGEHTQKLLNEISRARVTLVNPDARAGYDTVLQVAEPADVSLGPNIDQSERLEEIDEEDIAIEPTIGNYELLEPTSATRLGLIFKAQHRETRHFASLKMLPAQARNSTEALKRFQREMELTTKLSHANLIVGIEKGVQNGIPYLVTEYVMGTDLSTLVKTRGPLPIDEAVDYVAQAARGLTQLHMQGVYHRNLKPQVLLVDTQGRVKVGNLFLAKVDSGALFGGHEKLTIDGQMIGSVGYLAPEQADDAASADGRSDIYSLGCTLYYLLVGRSPYHSKSPTQILVGHATQPVPSLQEARPDIPRPLEQVYRKMMSKDPAGRFQFAGDAVDALEKSLKKPLLSKLMPWKS